MLEHFTPEDKEFEDKDYHKQVRAQALQPPNTADNREFTTDKIKNIIASMGNKPQEKMESPAKFTNKRSTSFLRA